MNSENTSPSNRVYLPQLDGLRFIAFLMVFFHHYSPIVTYFPRSFFSRIFFPVQSFSWVGVDVFLTLSAFLIFTLLLAEKEKTGTVSIRRFYIRRALRIWPLYYPYLLIGFLLPAFTEPGYDLATIAKYHLAPALAFLLNFSFVQFSATMPFSLSHLWTISLEEQFYVFAPLAVFFFASAGKRRIALAMAGLFLFTMAARAYVMLTSPPYLATWVLPLCRLDPLLIGAGLAFVYHRRPDVLCRWRGEWLALAALALFIEITRFPSMRGSLHTIWQLSASAISCGLLVVAVLGRGLIGKILSCRPLPFLGKISFGLYIYHEICLHYTPILFHSYTAVQTPENWILGFIQMLGITILLGSASYLLYERPFLKLKRRFEVVAARPV